MQPVLLQLGPITIYTYGAMLVLSFVLSTWAAIALSKRLPIDCAPLCGSAIVDLISWAMLGGVVGARGFFVLLNWPVFLANPLELFAIWHGGLIWYGGFFGGVLAAWSYLKANRIPVARSADQLAPFIALGHAVGRVGCFFNGCCHGRPSEAWWAVQSPLATPRVLPIQLIEAAALGLLAVGLVAWQLKTRKRSDGSIFGIYLLVYAAIRFFLEFLRGDQTVWLFGLTLQQGISLFLFAVGIWLAVRRRLTRAH